MFLRTYIQYKLQRWYTFIIGISLATINNDYISDHHQHQQQHHRPIAFLSHQSYKTSSNRVTKKTETATAPKLKAKKNNKKKNHNWIMKSQCRCGKCEIDITWDSTNTRTTGTGSTTLMRPKDTYTWDCYCSKCRIYHGSVFTSFAKVSNEQVMIRKQSTMQYYKHTCDEIHDEHASSTSPKTSSADTDVVIVERIFCSNCYCKLATTATTTAATTSDSNTIATADNKVWYFNLGCIVDKTIRADFALYWRNHRASKQTSQTVSWYPALPRFPKASFDRDEDEDEEEDEGEDEENNISNDDENDEEENSVRNEDNNKSTEDTTDDSKDGSEITAHPDISQPIRGGCACGRVQYQINHSTIDVPNELPICYCRLCRQMHGTAFVPWIYMTNKKNHFQWITNDAAATKKSTKNDDTNSSRNDDAAIANKKALKLIRTTSFGQRHVCTYCGVVLTILYDEEKKEYIWPTAASIYDHQYLNSTGSHVINSVTPTIRTNQSHTETSDNNSTNDNNNNSHPIHNDILQSVRHIYCQDNANWYQIPKDGLPRSYHE